jgi:hypothetical protein
LPVPHWYTIPAIVNGNTISFTILDGGVGDDDLTVNGTIVDQGGPGMTLPAAPVPALDARAITVLGGLVCLWGLWAMKRSTRSARRTA